MVESGHVKRHVWQCKDPNRVFPARSVAVWPKARCAMRGLLITLLVSGWICVLAGAAEMEGLVAHYPFDEGSGEIVHDRSGHGNDGKVIGGAEWVKGGFGTALSFDGRDDYVDCASSRTVAIGKTGTLLFWFQPREVCQGGLVCWARGPAQSDQRMVTTLKEYESNKKAAPETCRELHARGSNGKHSYSLGGQSGLRPGEWTQIAITLNGRSTDLYRDGVWVGTRIQAVPPATGGVPLLLGKCPGLDKQYFKGVLDEVRVYRRALSDQEVYQLYMQDVPGRNKDSSNFGTLGIKPVVNPKAGAIFADLDYRGLAPTAADLTIKAQLFDLERAVVAAGKVRKLPVWGRAEAVFEVSKLPPGDYLLGAVASTGEAAMTRVAWPGREPGWENIKVLNNLCWELLNESPGANPGSEYTFTNPRVGWVYFSSEAQGNYTLSVPGARPLTIRSPGGGVHQEAMRWLPQGEHTVTVKGAGKLKRLIARSIPMLAFFHYPHVGPGTGDDSPYMKQQGLLRHYNTLMSGGGGSIAAAWTGPGGHWIEVVYKSKVPKEAQGIYEYLTNAAGLSDPVTNGVIIDEFDPGNNDRQPGLTINYDYWCEALERIFKDRKYAGRLIVPFVCKNMYDFEKSTKFCRTVVDHGSYLSWNRYISERETEATAWFTINQWLAAQMANWEREVPGTTEHLVANLGYFWRLDQDPGADFKVFMDMQFEHLATRPEFFGLPGIMEYASHYSTEEKIHWQAKLYRPYCIEGNTERAGTNPYVRAQIKNPDFFDGADGWTLEPAEPGSMGVRSYTGYGYLQQRFEYVGYLETYFMWARRCANKPNIFSQEVSNLVPGQIYTMRMNIADYQDLVNGVSADKELPCSIRIENAKMLRMPYKQKPVVKSKSRHSVGPFNSNHGFHAQWLSRRFRARGTSARLVISDWKTGTTAGGAVGQEMLFSFIEVQPYYEGRSMNDE